jgi:hypothetical protein
MIDRLFQTEPTKRIDITEIRSHPFYLMHKPESVAFGLSRPLDDPTRLNYQIITKLEDKLGFSQASVLKAIATNRHNHMTATYYLMLKKLYMVEKRPYAESFMDQKNNRFKEIKHKASRQEPEEVFEKTAGSVDPDDLVKFSQRGTDKMA